VRDDDATGCQHILDHAQAERKPEIEPYRMGNHFCRKSMATIKRISGKSGHAARPHIFTNARLTLRCPVVFCVEQTYYEVLEARIKTERIFGVAVIYAADHGPKVAAKSAGATSGCWFPRRTEPAQFRVETNSCQECCRQSLTSILLKNERPAIQRAFFCGGALKISVAFDCFKSSASDGKNCYTEMLPIRYAG
jgi:hypothetical protein